MRRSVVFELDLPKDWRSFRLPHPLHQRLQELLDRQGSNPLDLARGVLQPVQPGCTIRT